MKHFRPGPGFMEAIAQIETFLEKLDAEYAIRRDVAEKFLNGLVEKAGSALGLSDEEWAFDHDTQTFVPVPREKEDAGKERVCE